MLKDFDLLPEAEQIPRKEEQKPKENKINNGTFISQVYTSSYNNINGQPHQECYQSQSIEQLNDGHNISEVREAYKNSDGKLVVVAINHSDNSYAQQFNVSGKTIKNITRYKTSQTENLAVTKNLALTGNGWWAQLNAKTVSTFVVS